MAMNGAEKQPMADGANRHSSQGEEMMGENDMIDESSSDNMHQQLNKNGNIQQNSGEMLIQERTEEI